jgi:hypothetical protein
MDLDLKSKHQLGKPLLDITKKTFTASILTVLGNHREAYWFPIYNVQVKTKTKKINSPPMLPTLNIMKYIAQAVMNSIKVCSK